MLRINNKEWTKQKKKNYIFLFIVVVVAVLFKFKQIRRSSEHRTTKSCYCHLFTESSFIIFLNVYFIFDSCIDFRFVFFFFHKKFNKNVKQALSNCIDETNSRELFWPHGQHQVTNMNKYFLHLSIVSFFWSFSPVNDCSHKPIDRCFKRFQHTQ